MSSAWLEMLLIFPKQMFRKKDRENIKIVGQILSEINGPTKI